MLITYARSPAQGLDSRICILTVIVIFNREKMVTSNINNHALLSTLLSRTLERHVFVIWRE
jgi:hypothetical protein